MGAMSNYLEEKILNAVLRNVAFTSPATVYVALYKTDPTDAGTGTEVSGGAYVRKAVTFGAPTQVNGKATVSNSADVLFPIATASWGTITHIAIMDALTVGNTLYYGALTTSKLIDVDDQFKIPTGNLTLDID